MVNMLWAILISLALAYLLGECCKMLGLPRVVGQIGAGLILSLGGLKLLLFSDGTMDLLGFLANLGLILLFYYIGLETNFQAFTSNLRRSILISLFNTLLPLTLGFLVMHYLLGASVLLSVIVGIALSVSAQDVSIDLLEELRLLKSKLGNMIVTAGAVDDVIELFFITALLSLMHVQTTDVSIASLTWGVALFLVIIIAAKLWFIPSMLRFFEMDRSSTAHFTGSLIIVLLNASLS